jgi:hypothetical protein
MSVLQLCESDKAGPAAPPYLKSCVVGRGHSTRLLHKNKVTMKTSDCFSLKRTRH